METPAVVPDQEEARPMGALRISRFLSASTLAFLAACGGGGGGFAPPPTEVAIVTVQPETVPVSYEFSAQVIPFRRVEVRPRVEGIIQDRSFAEGMVVSPGQVLYRIEPVKYEAAFHAAEARVQSAKARVDRYEPLLAQH